METLPAVLTILILIITSGIFSLFKYAFDSCQITRLEKETGGIYRSVIKEIKDPKKLSLACRIWINMLKITASLIAGMTVMRFCTGKDISGVHAALTALGSVLILIIFAALFTDALPKFFSRVSPEKTAARLLMPVKLFYIPLIPVILPVLKLDAFFNSALHIESRENNITEDDLRDVLIKGEKSGIVESKERTMVEGVFYLGDRDVGAFMTHRSEIQWLDINAPYEEIKQKALEYRRQRCFPVVDKNPDEIVGAADLEDIILDIAQDSPKGLRAIMKKAQFIPETMSALKAFESFKQGDANFLFVMDEYGGLAGVISIRALVEEIVGELSASVQKKEALVKQEDGSWLADGTLNIDDAAEALSLADLREKGDFHTLAGFVLSLAGELPHAGDSFKYEGYCFLVKEMDGNRINKILITVTENQP